MITICDKSITPNTSSIPQLYLCKPRSTVEGTFHWQNPPMLKVCFFGFKCTAKLHWYISKSVSGQFYKKLIFENFWKNTKGGPLASFSAKNASFGENRLFWPLDGSKTVFWPHFHSNNFLSLTLFVSST